MSYNMVLTLGLVALSFAAGSTVCTGNGVCWSLDRVDQYAAGAGWTKTSNLMRTIYEVTPGDVLRFGWPEGERHNVFQFASREHQSSCNKTGGQELISVQASPTARTWTVPRGGDIATPIVLGSTTGTDCQDGMGIIVSRACTGGPPPSCVCANNNAPSCGLDTEANPVCECCGYLSRLVWCRQGQYFSKVACQCVDKPVEPKVNPELIPIDGGLAFPFPSPQPVMRVKLHNVLISSATAAASTVPGMTLVLHSFGVPLGSQITSVTGEGWLCSAQPSFRCVYQPALGPGQATPPLTVNGVYGGPQPAEAGQDANRVSVEVRGEFPWIVSHQRSQPQRGGDTHKDHIDILSHAYP